MTTLVSKQSRDALSHHGSIGATSRIPGGSDEAKICTATVGPTGNRLLAALPGDEYRKLLPHLQRVALPFGKALSEPGERLRFGYFPTGAVVSLLTPIKGHGTEEVAVVGSEGMIGVSIVLEGQRALGPLQRPVVDSAGYAYRVRADVLATEFDGCVALQHLLLRYTQALISQIALSAVCNRHHRLDQQLARWLLQRLDRSSGCDVGVTQQRIAERLGVRRESVTQAAHALQRAGCIRCKRGRMTVLNRAELERRVCECHAVIAMEYARLLPRLPPRFVRE